MNRDNSNVNDTQLVGGLASDSYGNDNDRPPVVLLHGLSFDRTMWRPALAEMRRIDPGRRVLDSWLRADEEVTTELRHSGLMKLRPQPLVIARLLGKIEKQVPQPPAREREKLTIVRDPKKHLRHREHNKLSVSDARSASRSAAFGQEVIHAHVKCREKGVKVGEHEATSVVDVAIATPSFGALLMSPRRNPTRRSNLESTI